jgi:phospholipid/cholesterol/gamma-HCH transport system ATP-binding protein
MPATAKIELQGVAKSFGDNAVLKGINLQVAAGESLVIIGTSGCGKSVTLKCLNGLITPDRGSIKIDGVEILRGWSCRAGRFAPSFWHDFSIWRVI